MQIYLDYSATTPPRAEVIAAIEHSLRQEWGNPASLHEGGRQAAWKLETARMQVARCLHAPHDSIVFTSGGTEANNWVFQAVFQAVALSARRDISIELTGATTIAPPAPHLIISSVEHSAVTRPAQRLQQFGWEVTVLPVNRDGRVNPHDLAAAIQPSTVLVSIIYGQSEVGTLQPIAELGAIAQARGILFHTDAVQAMGRVPIDVQTLPIDLLSMSSHKLYGAKGAGALYIRPGCELAPLLLGGGQEMGWRSGTPATPAIIGFGVAAECAARELEDEATRLQGLRDQLFAHFADHPALEATGHPRDRLPHHVSFCLRAGLPPHLTGRSLVKQLDLAGIAASSGSACNSGAIAPSSTLVAMGYSPEQARGALRLTLGRDTTAEDIDWTAFVLRQILDRLLESTSA